MSNHEYEKGNGDMQGEKPSAYGVSPDEPKAKSASVRGFESHPPHFLMNPVVSPSVLGEILSFGLWMRKQGYA